MNVYDKVMREAERVDLDFLVRRERANGIFGEYSKLKYLERAPGHVKAMLERSKRFPGIFGLKQGFAGMVMTDPPNASFTGVGSSSTAETNLWQLPSLWSAIPAGDMTPGKVYRVECFGVASANGTPTVTWTGRVGQSTTPASNSLLGSSSRAIATGSSISSVPFYATLTMQVRSIGIAASGGVCFGYGFSVLGNLASTASQVATFGGSNGSIDNTTAQGLIISITFGASDVANVFTTQAVWLRSLN